MSDDNNLQNLKSAVGEDIKLQEQILAMQAYENQK
jgi:hypothetical protein